MSGQQPGHASKPTREGSRVAYSDGSLTETETAALNSIEVARHATVKDGQVKREYYTWTIKRYYRPDEDAAAVIAAIWGIDAQLHADYDEPPGTPLADQLAQSVAAAADHDLDECMERVKHASREI